MTSVLALGSNVGDRADHLRAGLDLVGRVVPVVATSPVYETEPVGSDDPAPYLNCVALVGSDDPELVFTAARMAEDVRGRVRAERWGPRTLDVDIVAVDAIRSADPRLTLPHPRAHERAFVLVPWLDIDPNAELPGHGSVRSLLLGVDAAGVRRWSS